MGAKMGSAKYCAELKMAEARPRSDSGKPGGDDAAVAGKDGRLEQTGEDAQNEDRGECGAGGEVAGEGSEKCAHRPADDGDAVDALRSEAVEQAAGRQLAQRVGPAEGEEQIAQALQASDSCLLGIDGTACESAERSAKLKQLTTKRMVMMR